jgi:hypothetical protein
MKVQTDVRAGGFRCGGRKGCGWGSLVYADVDVHIKNVANHNSIDVLSGNVIVVNDNDGIDIY